MIIVGRYHGIRLYEREVQPHDYVGIDIAKLNHFASAISSEGEILIEPFKFTNDYDGFYLLLSYLAPLDQNNIIIGLESTAHYSNNLVRFLITKDFKLYVLNPLSTSSMRKNNIRKTKADKVDAFVIAKPLMMQDSLRFITLKDLDYIELKELRRFCQKTVKQRTHLKIQLTSYIDQVFPELQYFFLSPVCIRILSMPSLRRLRHRTISLPCI